MSVEKGKKNFGILLAVSVFLFIFISLLTGLIPAKSITFLSSFATSFLTSAFVSGAVFVVSQNISSDDKLSKNQQEKCSCCENGIHTKKDILKNNINDVGFNFSNSNNKKDDKKNTPPDKNLEISNENFKSS